MRPIENRPLLLATWDSINTLWTSQRARNFSTTYVCVTRGIRTVRDGYLDDIMVFSRSTDEHLRHLLPS